MVNDYKDNIQYEIIKFKKQLFDGNLIKIFKNSNFNFDYILFIPNNIKSECPMIIEGSNVSNSANSLEKANEMVLQSGMSLSSPILDTAGELGLPVLYPFFPRVRNNDETIYNHMLSTNSLDKNTPLLIEYGLERVDLQLIEMFKDAKEKLFGLGIKIDDKFIINGFSASAKFANRFTMLHPEYVKMCIAGGVSGILTLPIDKYKNNKLLWPIGIGNINDLIGHSIDSKQVEEFIKVPQFYYMGDQDKNNPFVFNELGEVRYKGIINKDELTQIDMIFGKNMINERWKISQKMYNDLGINAKFKTYIDCGHDPRPATDDIRLEIEELLKIKNNSK